MKNDYILFNVFKDKGLITGLIISLLTHFFLFTIFPIKEDKLLGDKYIPIAIVDIKSPIIKGDSINESEKTNNKKISNKENNFKQKSKEKSEEKSEEKLEKKIDDKKIEDYKKETLNKKVEESSLKKITSQQSQLENENKIRGIEKGIKSNKTEAGSIQGKGYQKVTCLNCVEPKYPKLAIKRGYEGVLKLEILILKSGKVKEVFIRESTGFEILDKAGVNAAFKSKFYPLTKKTNLNIEYTLKLNRR
mgnify:CR=1 FL=1